MIMFQQLCTFLDLLESIQLHLFPGDMRSARPESQNQTSSFLGYNCMSPLNLTLDLIYHSQLVFLGVKASSWSRIASCAWQLESDGQSACQLNDDQQTSRCILLEYTNELFESRTSVKFMAVLESSSRLSLQQHLNPHIAQQIWVASQQLLS